MTTAARSSQFRVVIAQDRNKTYQSLPTEVNKLITRPSAKPSSAINSLQQEKWEWEEDYSIYVLTWQEGVRSCKKQGSRKYESISGKKRQIGVEAGDIVKQR